MANSLLDFVLSLVRDPQAAERYAADPAAAIADAHLAGVTSADVDNLIPMVADSMAASAPGFNGGIVQTDGGNVWTTGAATAAFDAFETVDHQVQSVIHDPATASAQIHDVFSEHAQVIDAVGQGLTGQSELDQSELDQSGLDHIESTLDDVSTWSDPGGWEHVHDAHPDAHPGVDHLGFDANP